MVLRRRGKRAREQGSVAARHRWCGSAACQKGCVAARHRCWCGSAACEQGCVAARRAVAARHEAMWQRGEQRQRDTRRCGSAVFTSTRRHGITVQQQGNHNWFLLFSNLVLGVFRWVGTSRSNPATPDESAQSPLSNKPSCCHLHSHSSLHILTVNLVCLFVLCHTVEVNKEGRMW